MSGMLYGLVTGQAAVWIGCLALLSAVLLVAEWHAILRFLRVDSMSLAHVEAKAVRIPRKIDVAAANLLTVLFMVLSVQFVAIVYAMSFTLLGSTAEEKDSSKIVFADVDGDGDADAVFFNRDGSNTFKNDIYTNSSGAFSHAGTFDTSYDFRSATAGDIDNDGDVDFIIAYFNGVNIAKLVNNGAGSFSLTDIASSLTTSVKRVLLIDVDSDGDQDVVTGGNAHSRSVYLNDGSAGFTLAESTLPAFADMAHGDFDSDGDIDLILTDPAGGSYDFLVYQNSGTGAFTQLSTATSQPALDQNSATVGDYDGDGDLDVLLSVNDGGSAQVYAFRNNGAGTFSSWHEFGSSLISLYDVGAGDLDNDGDLDAVVPGFDSVNEAWFYNAGSEIFEQNGSTSEADFTNSVALADINGDGDLDYAVANQSGLGNDGANRFYASDQSGTSANTSPTAPSDSSMTGALVTPSARGGGTAANDTGVGASVWNNVSEALAEGGNVALDSTTLSGEITNYLKITNFRANVPSDATITGVKAEFVKRRSNATYTVNDYEVRLVKGGSISGNNKADTTTNWPTVLAYATYGGASDLWGLTLTPSDVNAANFGVAIAAINNGVTASSMAHVDYVRLTVYYDMRNIRLSWGSGSDTQTPTRLLQYQIKVGTTSGGQDIVSAATASPNWVTRLMPNGQSKMYTLKNLECGMNYYWSVATVDTGFRKTWSSEKSFALGSDCGFTGDGSGSSPPPPPPSGGGGGYVARTTPAKTDDSSGASPGFLTVTAFRDVNSDGVKQEGEPQNFRGLPVTASGSTMDGTPVRKTLVLGERGTVTFELPPSDVRGYHVLYDTGSTAIKDEEATTKLSLTGSVLKSDMRTEVFLGFRRTDLVHYAPCLLIASTGDIGLSEAETLLRRLTDAFGKQIMDGISLSGSLVTRKDYFGLLQRTQCIDLVTDEDALKQAVRTSGSALIDLPLSTRNAVSVLVYSLMKEGISVGRRTALGPAADLSSPVSRREAIQTVFDALKIPLSKVTETGGTLPIDLPKDDPLVPAYLTLQSLGVLPESFLRVLGPNQGITGPETALLLVRASFRAGKIPLVTPTISAPKTLKDSAPTPTFLATVPALQPITCLERTPERAQTLSFSDILPGDPVEADLRELLTRGLRSKDKKMLWLIPATRRPTEFGVEKGQSRLNLQEPVSVLETLRNLLVLSCLPPELNEKGKNEGSGESRIPRDRISDVPRENSFASRVLYRAQDRQREFDLSLFSYAQEFLRLPTRSPADPLTVGEASSILASALLRTSVLQKSLTPQEAEGKAKELAAAIAKDLLGKDLDWRDEAILRNTPFTRDMLLHFLATVVRNRTTVSSSPQTSAQTLPLGEVWWQRVR